MTLPTSFIQSILERIDSPDVIGVGIVGSYARGQASRYSDVDMDIYVSRLPESPYDRYTLRYWDQKLVSLKYTLLDDERSALTQPRRAIWAVPGLRGMRILLDKDGSLCGTYRKMHIPDDPAFYEKFYFTPGDATKLDGGSGFTPIQTSVGKLGVLICWDQWYPEGARLMALAGAEILLYPTAIGWDPNEQEAENRRQKGAWQTIQRAHAIANGVYVAAVNRVGHEGPTDGGLEFWGASFVCDPFGVVLAEAPRDAEAILVADCDLAHQEEVRRSWPFLRDRRIDAYAPLFTRIDPKLIEQMTEASKDTLAPAAAAPVAKTEQKQAAPAVAPAPDAVAHIGIDDFGKLDLRVGKVLACEFVEGSDKLLRFELDAGALGKRQIFSGIRASYGDPAALVGRNVVFIANLAPRKMRFGVSEGMILSAGDDGGALHLLDAPDAPAGAPIK